MKKEKLVFDTEWVDNHLYDYAKKRGWISLLKELQNEEVSYRVLNKKETQEGWITTQELMETFITPEMMDDLKLGRNTWDMTFQEFEETGSIFIKRTEIPGPENDICMPHVCIYKNTYTYTKIRYNVHMDDVHIISVSCVTETN